jgi:hypothetical protein
MLRFPSLSLFRRRISRSEHRYVVTAAWALFLALAWMAVANVPAFAGSATTTKLTVASGGNAVSTVATATWSR